MKINYFSNGGAAGFSDYAPVDYGNENVAATESADDSSLQGSSGSGNLTEKDFYNMLKTVDGLPSDILAMMNDISNLTRMQNLFAGTHLANTSSLSLMYISALTKLKIAKFNKELFDDTMKEVMEKKDCLNELAITSGGGIVAMDAQGNITELSILDFLANRDKYQGLTNSNLLKMRAEQNTYAFLNNVLDIVKNGVGMKSIIETVDSVVKNLGSQQSTSTGYVAKEGEQITGAVELLQAAAAKGGYGKGTTLDGLYKAKLINKSLAESINAALAFLLRAMPKNQVAWLKLKSGNTENPDKGAVDMLTTILSSKNTEELSLDLEYKEDLNTDGSKKSSTDKSQLSPSELFIKGEGEEGMFQVQNETGDTINLVSTTLPVTEGGSPVGQTTAINLTKSDFGGILDMSNASMGGHKINQDGLNQVIVDGAAAHKVVFPVERLPDGTVVPNFKMLKKMEEVRALVKQKGAKTAEEINAIYQSQGLPLLIKGTNPDGSFIYNMTDYDTFAVFNATATSRAFGQDLDITDRSLLEITDKNRVENTLDIIYGNDRKRNSEGVNWDEKGWNESLYEMFGGTPEYDRLLQGTLWIRCRTNMMNAIAGSRMKPSISDTNDIREKTQQNERLNNAQVAGQLEL